MKANMIAVATEGALTDVPSSTANLLAWNGGGKSNYTEIIAEGGHSVDRTVQNFASDAKAEFKKLVSELESLVEEL